MAKQREEARLKAEAAEAEALEAKAAVAAAGSDEEPEYE
jgi:hypothetical protein